MTPIRQRRCGNLIALRLSKLAPADGGGGPPCPPCLWPRRHRDLRPSFPFWVKVVLSYVLCALTLSTAAHAQTNRGDGSQTGDGSTAFTGLAQAPEANLFVGAATTSINIEVPPGRRNLTPKLALTYNSNGGPSPYGYGWDLPLGKIQRSTKHGVLSCTDPTYRNDFVLVLPGASVECTLEPSGSPNLRCIPKIEESFLRIDYVPNGNYWQVWDKSGLKYKFGVGVQARTGSDDTTLFAEYPALSTCRYTHSWALTQISDPNDNYLELNYQDVDGVLYPTRILYGGGNGGQLAHKFEVRFVWSDDDDFERPPGDRIVNGMGGFSAKLTKLLSRIEVRHPALTTDPGHRVRWYSLGYEFIRPGVVPPRVGRQSFLSTVTLYDRSDHALSRDDSGNTPVETKLLYQQSDPAQDGFGFAQLAQSPEKPPLEDAVDFVRWSTGGSDPKTLRDVFDINGDGIPDLVETWGCGWECSDPSCPPGSAYWVSWKVFLGEKDANGGPRGFALTAREWQVPENSLQYCVIRESNAGSTKFDTLDINGDGIPDLVNSWGWAAGGTWTVYLGQSSAWGFSQTPTEWPAPVGEIRRSRGGVDYLGWTDGGSVDELDLIDINGDGLVDVVQAESDNPSPRWTVWYNTGDGFETGPGTSFPTAYKYLRYTTAFEQQVLGLADINGDGLPDQIMAWQYGNYPGYWMVYLNTGHRFSSTGEQWDLPRSACSNPDGHGWVGLRKTREGDVYRDFFDINGDGLPDVVDTCGWPETGRWKVYLNRGAGFAASEDWYSPSDFIRDGNSGDGSVQRDTFDADGDGLVDFIDFRTSPYLIYHSADGAWCASTDGNTCSSTSASLVAPNPDGAKPDLLERIENGLGGATVLEYRPSTQWDNTGGDEIPDLPFNLWTVTRIERDDGMCDDDGANCTGVDGSGHSLVTTFRYQDGRFDPLDREFRGFWLVRSEQGEPEDPLHAVRVTWFHQTLALKGKVDQAATYQADGGSPPANFYAKPLTHTFNAWECFDPQFVEIDCPNQLTAQVPRVIVRLKQESRWDYINFMQPRASFTANVGFDQYNNVNRSLRGGDGVPTVHTYTDFAYHDTETAYIVDKPTHVRVEENGAVLEKKWFAYDSLPWGAVERGNVTAVYSWLDQVVVPGLPTGTACPASGGNCVLTQMTYDTYGNITRVTDANGNSTDTTYDTTQIYPLTVTNARGHKVTTQYDAGCGQLLWQTIPYVGTSVPSQRTEHQYDTFCRPTKTWLPDEAITGPPHQQFVYYLGTLQEPTYVLSYIREPNHPAGAVARTVFTDALGRVLQEKHEAVVDGVDKIVAGSTRSYDGRGNVSATYAPFVAGTASDDLRDFSPRSPTDPKAASEYDALGRVTRVTNADNSYRLIEHNVAWQTTTKDECYTSGGTCPPGGKVVEKRDAFGRVSEKQLYQGDTFEARTGYTYDGLGRLKTTKQGTTLTSWNSNTTISVTYDSLGRKITMTDPDSGTWRYGYDLVGNVLYEDDPKLNQYTEFCYDQLNRVRRKYQTLAEYDPLIGIGYGCNLPGSGNDVNIDYTYDAADVAYSLGRLTRVDDSSGATLFQQYDERGRLRELNKRIHIPDVDPAGGYKGATIYYQYDAADHLTQVTYPDLETVVQGYDVVGQPISLRNTYVPPTVYVQNATYDLFGRLRVLTRGNSTTDTREYWGPEKNHRLKSIVTAQQGVSLPHLSLSYADYSKTGQLTTLDDQRNNSGVLSNDAAFTYDGLGRLTGANGPNLPYPAGPNGYGYDALGNITKKEGTTLSYGSATQPHTLTAINGSAASHDLNGNRTGKPSQTYGYDTDDRVTRISVVGQGELQFTHDYAGQRVVTRRTDGTYKRDFDTLAEYDPSAGTGVLIKWYMFGGQRLASKPWPWTPESGLLAAGPADATVWVAGLDGIKRIVDQHPLSRSQTLALALAVLGLTALLTPGRRRPVVGIAVRHGHVLGVLLVFTLATLPLPRELGERTTGTAWAGGGGLPACGGASDWVQLRHYHVDHLGSTQVVTYQDGKVIWHTRYKPYGELRGHWDCNGTGLTLDGNYRYEFTGYETQAISGLEYAGARFYDPALGMFLTHDPARQFANPYAYGPWDPVNGTDPSGQFWFIPAIVGAIKAFVVAHPIWTGVIVGALASSAQAAANGASVGDALQAGVVGGALGGATAFGLGVVGGVVSSFKSPALSLAFDLAVGGSGLYSIAEGYRSGQYVAAGIGATMLAFALIDRAAQGGNGQTKLGNGYETSTQDVDLDTRLAQAQGQTANDAAPIAPGQTQPRVYEGDASYYDLPGNRTASGAQFDSNASAGAMTADKAPLGARVTVESTTQTPNGPVTTRVEVTINDRGPFAVGPNGRALMPLQPHPTRIIDLTPSAFRSLTGSLRAGHVPVRVTVP